MPTVEDAFTLLRLLARSATGQEFSTYTTVMTGPKRPDDLDGPEQLPRRPARQWPLADAGQRAARDAALHPLRRLHEPLPGLSRHRRPCLWLGLSRPDGRGADAAVDRDRAGLAAAQRLDLLRPLRGGLPGADPAAEADAHWREEQFRRQLTPAAARYGLGVWAFLRQAPGALPFRRQRRDARPAAAQPRRSPALGAAGRRLDRQPRSAGAARPPPS